MLTAREQKEELDHVLYSTKTAIVVGTEYWLIPDIKDHKVFPPYFTVYRRDRGIGRRGGVFIVVRADVVCLREKELETECKILWIKLHWRTLAHIIGLVLQMNKASTHLHNH